MRRISFLARLRRRRFLRASKNKMFYVERIFVTMFYVEHFFAFSFVCGSFLRKR